MRGRALLYGILERLKLTESGNIFDDIKTGVAGDVVPTPTPPSRPFIKKKKKGQSSGLVSLSAIPTSTV